MANCPKCGKRLDSEDYVLEDDILIPSYFTLGNRAMPISCKHCGTLLGFRT